MRRKKYKMFNFLAFFLTIVILLSNNSFLTNFTPVYYASIIFSTIVVYFLASNEKKTHNILVLFLYISSILSFTVNDVNPIFQPLERFLIFLIATLLIGPFINSHGISFFRVKLLYNLLYSVVALVILSFILNLTGIYKGYAVSEVEGVLMYRGVFNHTMLMSPLAAISFLTILSLYIKPVGYFNKFKRTKKKTFHLTMIFCLSVSFLSAIMAGSRGAVGALVFSIIIFLIMYNQFKIQGFFKQIFLIFVLLIVSFPLWQEKTDFLVSKIENNNAAGGSTASRDDKWSQRIDEFTSSPIIGIGFGSIDPNGKDFFNKENGQIEPGSSWLSILSMTGAVSFIAVFILFMRDIIRLYRIYIKIHDVFCLLLAVILVFFSVHMIVEGYFLSAGSLGFFMVWLTLGASEFYINQVQKK